MVTGLSGDWLIFSDCFNWFIFKFYNSCDIVPRLLLQAGGGVRSNLLRNGMSRAPLVRFSTAKRAAEAKAWMEHPENFEIVAECFNSTSRSLLVMSSFIVE